MIGPNNPLRFSRLRLMAQSPAHFAYGYTEPTSGMDVGAAAHSLILGGRTVVGYLAGKSRRGKEFDKWLADQAPDAIVLSASEFDHAQAIAASVKRDKVAMSCLDGVREQTLVSELYGFPARGTPDVRGSSFVTELKTGETSDPRKFPYKLLQFCYHGQLGWYADLCEQLFHGPIADHYIVTVEQKRPCVCTTFRIGQRTIEQGRKLVRLWTERLRVCMDSNSFPGYASAPVELDLPEQDNEIIFEEAA